jgi:hypothetical protein
MAAPATNDGDGVPDAVNDTAPNLESASEMVPKRFDEMRSGGLKLKLTSAASCGGSKKPARAADEVRRRAAAVKRLLNNGIRHLPEVLSRGSKPPTEITHGTALDTHRHCRGMLMMLLLLRGGVTAEWRRSCAGV